MTPSENHRGPEPSRKRRPALLSVPRLDLWLALPTTAGSVGRPGRPSR
jgi:hypothetical protein